jgi:hypothetical protein
MKSRDKLNHVPIQRIYYINRIFNFENKQNNADEGESRSKNIDKCSQEFN